MKKVLIMRGISGSGKSTYVKDQVVAVVKDISLKVCSADLFFIRNGQYLFDPTKQSEAHAWCFETYMTRLINWSAVHDQNRLIVVDNTNISSWEISPYVLAASAYGFEHEIITLYCDPIVALKRNIHQIPAHVILNMHSRLLTERLPSFWKQSAVFEGE